MRSRSSSRPMAEPYPGGGPGRRGRGRPGIVLPADALRLRFAQPQRVLRADLLAGGQDGILHVRRELAALHQRGDLLRVDRQHLLPQPERLEDLAEAALVGSGDVLGAALDGSAAARVQLAVVVLLAERVDEAGQLVETLVRGTDLAL